MDEAPWWCMGIVHKLPHQGPDGLFGMEFTMKQDAPSLLGSL